MSMFVFILALVFNFSLYQAVPQSYGNQGSNGNNFQKPINRDQSPIIYDVQNPNTGESIYTKYFDGVNEVTSIGNGNNKHNVFNFHENPSNNPPSTFLTIDTNPKRKPTTFITEPAQNQPPTNYHSRYPNPQVDSNLGNRFGSVPNDERNSYPKTATRTVGNVYTRTSVKQHDIVNIENGYDQSSDRTGFLPNIDIHPEIKPNNVNIKPMINQPPSNYHEKYPNSQGNPNSDKQFRTVAAVPNYYPKTATSTRESVYTRNSYGRDEIVSIRNGQNNVGSFPNRGINQGRRPENRNGDFYPGKRTTNSFVSIGNGINNSNTFIINDNDRPLSVLSYRNGNNRRGTQQIFDRPKSNTGTINSENSFSPVGTYERNTYHGIGLGQDNVNRFIVNGKPVYSDSGLIVTTKEQREQDY